MQNLVVVESDLALLFSRARANVLLVEFNALDEVLLAEELIDGVLVIAVTRILSLIGEVLTIVSEDFRNNVRIVNHATVTSASHVGEELFKEIEIILFLLWLLGAPLFLLLLFVSFRLAFHHLFDADPLVHLFG